jgi:hypothetical protein
MASFGGGGGGGLLQSRINGNFEGTIYIKIVFLKRILPKTYTIYAVL